MRKFLSVLILAALLVGVLAGCQTGGEQAQAAGGEGTGTEDTLPKETLPNQPNSEIMYEPDLTLSEEQIQQFKRLYLAKVGNADANAEEKLSLRVVWRDEDLYALYVDGDREYALNPRNVMIPVVYDKNGKAIGHVAFLFLNDQLLYFVRDSAIYTLQEASDAGILTVSQIESLRADDVYKNFVLSEERKLSTELKNRIKRALLAKEHLEGKFTCSDLCLQPVWQSEDVHAVYIHGKEYTLDAVVCNTVQLPKPGNDNSPTEYYTFEFWNFHKLMIYKDDAIYSLEEAYEAGVLTPEHVEQLLENDTYKNSACYYFW